MNTKDLNDLLSTLLADSSTNFYTQSERLQALNSACNYINSELRILMTTETILYTPLDNYVPMPLDFASIGNGVIWQDAKGQNTALEWSSPAQLQMRSRLDWETDVGVPSNYVMEGGNIYITPTPTETGAVILSYVAMPNKLLNDTDLPFYGDPRIQSYHELIAYYAAWQLCMKDRDFEASQQFMAFFQSRFVDLKENLRRSGQTTTQTVWVDSYSTV